MAETRAASATERAARDAANRVAADARARYESDVAILRRDADRARRDAERHAVAARQLERQLKTFRESRDDEEAARRKNSWRRSPIAIASSRI